MPSPPALHQAGFPSRPPPSTRMPFHPLRCQQTLSSALLSAPEVSHSQSVHQLQTPSKIFPCFCVYSLHLGPASPLCEPYQLSRISSLQAPPLLHEPLPRTGPTAPPGWALFCTPLTFVMITSSRGASWRRWLPSQGGKQTSGKPSSQHLLTPRNKSTSGARWLSMKEQCQVCREAARPDLPGPGKTL